MRDNPYCMNQTNPADTNASQEAAASPLFNTLPLDAKLLRGLLRAARAGCSS